MEISRYNFKLQYYKMSMVYLCLLVTIKNTQFVTGIDLQDFTVCKDHYAGMMIQETWTIQNVFYCYFYCGRNSWCRALTIKPEADDVQCTFHYGIFSDLTCNSFPVLNNFGYRLLLKREEYVSSNDNGCLNGGTFNNGCICPGGFAGNYCERYLYDCKEAMNHNVLIPGIFACVLTKPPTSQHAFVSFCSAFGSTVILARNPRNYDLSFNRTWDEYKYAFGKDLNVWMGLEWIHEMSSYYGGSRQILLYCANLDTRNGYSVYYNSFVIDDESAMYEARVGPTVNVTSDLLGSPTEKRFCTYDKPCNGLPNSTMGGWWYVSGLEKHALTHPSTHIFCRRYDSDFEAHSISIAFELN